MNIALRWWGNCPEIISSIETSGQVSLKRDKKDNNSYIVTRIVTNIAQHIYIVLLNDLRFLGILIAAFVFQLLNVKFRKFPKMR